MQLPTCITARRIGHHSMGSENEYDADGEQAPITWTCNCGHRLTLEYIDPNTEKYVKVSEDVKAKFLAAHTNCTAVCFHCGVTPVKGHGYWCDECSEADNSVF